MITHAVTPDDTQRKTPPARQFGAPLFPLNIEKKTEKVKGTAGCLHKSGLQSTSRRSALQ